MKTLFGTVGELEGAMTYHRDRHGVLAGNIANLDTPGYRPLDLERLPGPTAAPAEGALFRTDPRHFAVAGTAAGEGGDVPRVAPAAGGAPGDGNAVSLEREMAKIDANRVRYATSSELASRRLALLRYTAGDGT